MTSASPGPRLPREPSHPRWARRQRPAGPRRSGKAAPDDAKGADRTHNADGADNTGGAHNAGGAHDTGNTDDPGRAGGRYRTGGDDDEPAGAKRRPSAYNAALNLLAVRDHSRGELAGRLARRGFEPDEIEAALVRLEQAKLLDEAAYAANFAAYRAARGVAATVIRRDLAAKGVDGELAARAAAEASPAEVEADRCRELATTWLSRHPGLPGPVAARRLAGFLARRGYQTEVVVRVVRALTNASDAGEADGIIDRDDDPDDPLG